MIYALTYITLVLSSALTVGPSRHAIVGSRHSGRWDPVSCSIQKYAVAFLLCLSLDTLHLLQNLGEQSPGLGNARVFDLDQDVSSSTN